MVVAGRAVPFMWGKKGGTAGVVALVPFGTRAFLFSPLSRGALRRRLEARAWVRAGSESSCRLQELGSWVNRLLCSKSASKAKAYSSPSQSITAKLVQSVKLNVLSS